jgi:hypothetical protein
MWGVGPWSRSPHVGSLVPMSPSERMRKHHHLRLPQRVDARSYRRARQELTDRLTAEYAGALPPGKVVAAVARAALVLRAAGLDDRSTWASVCESLARRSLTEGIARARDVRVPVGASAASA